MQIKNNDSFIITATNKEEICKVISSFNINKFCGPNSIPTKILHLIQDQISKHFATICNFSFSTGIFPTILKTVKVIPIHKKDSRLEVSDYRPISLLSNIDKSFEKLMHSRLIEFLEERQILYYKQFGFRKDFNKPWLFKFARNHSESTRWWANCIWDFYKPWKSISHCASWHSTLKTKSLWY